MRRTCLKDYFKREKQGKKSGSREFLFSSLFFDGSNGSFREDKDREPNLS